MLNNGNIFVIKVNLEKIIDWRRVESYYWGSEILSKLEKNTQFMDQN